MHKNKQAQECLERIVTRYVEEMVAKKHVFEKKTVQRMLEDEHILLDFCKKETNLEETTTAPILAVLTDLRLLLDAWVPPFSQLINQVMK